MKTKIISVALLAVLSSMAVGCHKETLVEPQGSVAEVGTVRTVLYTIDGEEHRATLYGDEEWKTFIDNVIELSGQGHEINIVDENAAANGIATKEMQTYTTTNKDAAATWTAEKVDNGYHVTVVHNTTSGEYTCIATK